MEKVKDVEIMSLEEDDDSEETVDLQLIELVDDLVEQTYDLLRTPKDKYSDLFKPSYLRKIRQMSSVMSDVLDLRDHYREFLIDSCNYPNNHFTNRVAVLNALHLGINYLEMLIKIGKKQPLNMDLHRYIAGEIDRNLLITGLLHGRDGLNFTTACNYSLYNITEH